MGDGIMFFRKSRSVEEFEIDEKFEILKNNFVNLVEGRIREIKSKKRFPIINEYKIISEIGNQLKSSNSSEFTWFLEKLKEIKDKKMFKELIKDKRERQILKTLLTQYEIGIYSDRNIPEKVLKKINELLLESEEIIYILEGGFGTHERKTGSAVKVEGTFGSGAMMGRPYLVLTNLRAIIYAKGWFTEDFRDFYYNDIVSVDFEKGLVFDSVTIHAPGSIEKFEVEKVKRDKTTEAVKILKNKISETKISTPSAQLQEDPIEKLKKLKELHDQGILTDEEFEMKKKELLDKI